MSKKKISKETYLKIKPMADDLRKAEVWCELDGVLTRSETMYNLYEMGYRKLSDNVIELPCKVGDKVYQTDGVRIYESTINEITLTTNKMICVTENIAFDETAIGKGIFLTKDEAEAKMKGGE